MSVSVSANLPAFFDIPVSSEPPDKPAGFFKNIGVGVCHLAGLKPKGLRYSDIERTELAAFKQSLRDCPAFSHLKFVTWNVMDPIAAASGLSAPRDLFPCDRVRVEKLVETLHSSLDAGVIGCLLQEAEHPTILTALHQAGLTVVRPDSQNRNNKQAEEISWFKNLLQPVKDFMTPRLHGHGLAIVFDGKKMELADPIKKPSEFCQYENQKTPGFFLSRLLRLFVDHAYFNVSASFMLKEALSKLLLLSETRSAQLLSSFVCRMSVMALAVLPLQFKWFFNSRDNFPEVVQAASAFRPDGLLTCHLKDKRTGDRYILCTTHLESFHPDIQQKQIDELIEKLKALRKENPNTPILVGGDFNQQEGHRELRNKLEKALGACVSKDGESVTFITDNKKLDKMFVIPPEGQTVEQVDGQPWFVNHDSKHLSDHALLSGGFRYKG